MSVPLLRWEVDGPYDVVFSTMVGGVSEGPFESLNLGRRTGDDVTHVDENRRRLCAQIDADEERLRRYRDLEELDGALVRPCPAASQDRVHSQLGRHAASCRQSR